MKVVIQRVSSAKVTVDEKIVGAIQQGLLLLVGIDRTDTPSILDKMAQKVLGLRIFANTEGRFDLSILDAKREILAVSQFTLIADLSRGKRPSFSEAARPEVASELFQSFVTRLKSSGLNVETGIFQAHMMVELVNDGPVTIVLDSKEFS